MNMDINEFNIKFQTSSVEWYASGLWEQSPDPQKIPLPPKEWTQLEKK